MKLLLLTASILLIAPIARSQSQLHVFEGTIPDQKLGDGVAGPGDLNGDGVPDILATFTGGVRAYDGATGRELWTLSVPSSFKTTVDAVGDVDFDSVGDFMVSMSYTVNRVQLYSGATLAMITEWDYGSSLVQAVCAAGDVDGDGYGDVAVAVGYWNTDVYIYSGTTHALIHQLSGFSQSPDITLSSAGDCNGDGFADILIGDQDYGGMLIGKVYLYSGATGALLKAWSGGWDWDHLGSAVAGIGDVNGDGYDDVAIVASTEYYYDAYLKVYSGTPPYFSVYTLWDCFGASDVDYHAISGVGDIDGDGSGDFLLAYSTSSGWTNATKLFSGATGDLIYATDSGYVSDLSRAGDIDGDGCPEMISGLAFDDPNGQDSGRVRVFRVACGPAPAEYCRGAANSAGPGASISFNGTPSLSHNEFSLLATGVVPNSFGFFYYGPEAIQIPFGNGFMCVGTGGVGLFRLMPPGLSDSSGSIERQLDFTQPPLSTGTGAVTTGSTWRFQLWYRDAAAGDPGFNLSSGLAVAFCP